MTNLQQLLDETALKYEEYNTLAANLESSASSIESLETDLDAARKTYDVAETERISSLLEGTKRVHNSMIKDLEDLDSSLKAELNGESGLDLAYKARGASNEDFRTVNRGLEVQNKFEEIEGLEEQIKVIKQGLEKEAQALYSERYHIAEGFNPFLTGRGNNVTLVSSHESKEFHKL